ncbi:MAG: hypothetical protein J2P46_16410 [Zavarzinella sp.]|nr:hypothetical protein [Zavarzinella sp.]
MRLRWAILLALASAAGCQDKKGSGPPPAGETSPPTAAVSTKDPPPPPAEGTVDGKPFRPDAVALEGKVLIFRAGPGPDIDLQFELPDNEGAKLAGREWSFGGKIEDPAVVLVVRGQKEKVVLGPDYTMTLKITGQTREAVEGTIDLTIKNPAGTALRGHFTATYRKTPAAPLGPDDAPYVHGKITLKGTKQVEKLAAGLVGRRDDGTPYSNEVGFPVEVGQPSYSTIPGAIPGQLSSLAHSEGGLTYRHVRVPPGDYLVYVRRDGIMSAWKGAKLKAGDQQTIDLTIDPATTGEVVVTLPERPVGGSLSLVPLNADLPELGLGGEQYFNVATVKSGEKRVVVGGIPAGKYRAVRGTDEAPVEVAAGKSVNVTLAPAKK